MQTNKQQTTNSKPQTTNHKQQTKFYKVKDGKPGLHVPQTSITAFSSIDENRAADMGAQYNVEMQMSLYDDTKHGSTHFETLHTSERSEG